MIDGETVVWWLRALCMALYAFLFLVALPFSLWAERYRPNWYRRLPKWLQ